MVLINLLYLQTNLLIKIETIKRKKIKIFEILTFHKRGDKYGC